MLRAVRVKCDVVTSDPPRGTSRSVVVVDHLYTLKGSGARVRDTSDEDPILSSKRALGGRPGDRPRM